ncbi:glyoxylate reductase (NADP(+)) [Salipiger sp. P9]|uniref:NAD(P)-dependent oxidoreductase n=1 Tax=Salipiger pentaromativorans TaxID=2943193 RepID=UPI002157C85B|nr:NAD(P)-dependent oxidoreductase [Salipiger pentaromativorans]MCR8547490.1 glyoxylate reductase (NADP(+)) [Salipiger pentaromativorans]
MTQPPLTIVNQINAEFGAFLAGLDGAPRVIDQAGTDRPWELPEETDVLFTRARGWRAAPDTPPALPRLKWVQTYSAGIENYPDWLKNGRIVTTGRGLTSPQIAEYVLAAMLRVEKDLDRLRARSPADWTESPLGTLEGKTLGVVGYGAIGQEVVQRAAGFGMRILASRRSAWTSPDPRVTACADARAVVAESDHLVLALPLTDQTRRSFDAEMFALARPGQHLVNVSRGGIVDQEALMAALDSGRLSFATLDVTDPEPLPEGHPLWTHPKVLLTPHVSYIGGPEMARFRTKTRDNLRAFLAGTPMTDVVSLDRGY